MVARRVFATLAFLLVLSRSPVVWADAAPSRGLDRPRVAWGELRYTAHKLGILATIEVRLDDASVVPPDTGVARRHGNASASVEDGEILLQSISRLPGRTFLARERLDPVLARAREIVDTETGAKNHRKTYILRERGFLLELLEPADGSETLLTPERWTRQTRSFASYPKMLPTDAVITGPAGLLYSASVAGLNSPGDSLTMFVLVQTRVERVTVRVEGVENVKADFLESSGGVLRSVHEQLSAVRLVARSQPVDPTSSSVFRMFGLEGDIEILWDPARRLPVEITGHVKVLGHVEARLASATLR
jgi:hypothetical protein